MSDKFTGLHRPRNEDRELMKKWRLKVAADPVVRVARCRTPWMWYARLVPHSVRVERVSVDGLWAREPAGYINVIRFEDVDLVPQAEVVAPFLHQLSKSPGADLLDFVRESSRKCLVCMKQVFPNNCPMEVEHCPNRCDPSPTGCGTNESAATATGITFRTVVREALANLGPGVTITEQEALDCLLQKPKRS